MWVSSISLLSHTTRVVTVPKVSKAGFRAAFPLLQASSDDNFYSLSKKHVNKCGRSHGWAKIYPYIISNRCIMCVGLHNDPIGVLEEFLVVSQNQSPHGRWKTAANPV